MSRGINKSNLGLLKTAGKSRQNGILDVTVTDNLIMFNSVMPVIFSLLFL